MEVRIAKLSMLLNRAVESSAKTNTNSDNTGEQFKSNIPVSPVDTDTDRQEKNEIDSQTAMLSLSSKGIKHSRLLSWQDVLEDENVQLSEDDSHTSYHAQMTDKLQGLSDQVINGELSTTDKMNFDAELKSLMALLENADDESKCEVLSERINDLMILINDATVYRNNHIALFKLTDPNYYDDI